MCWLIFIQNIPQTTVNFCIKRIGINVIDTLMMVNNHYLPPGRVTEILLPKQELFYFPKVQLRFTNFFRRIT